MKIFLDDERATPPLWTCFKKTTPLKAFLITHGNDVELLSLDHDLGEHVPTGYDFCCWLEELYHTDNIYWTFKIGVHSANPVGRTRMEQVLKRINMFTATKICMGADGNIKDIVEV